MIERGRVEELTARVCVTKFSMFSGERTSTWMAVASLPAAVISWATVVIVEDEELGSGGDVAGGLEGSVIVFAATTTSRSSVSGDIDL